MVGVCGCLDRVDISQRQLYNLEIDPSLWHFDSIMSQAMASLSSCHRFLNCAACSRSGSSLMVLVSLLDRTFDVLSRFSFHRTTRNNAEILCGHHYNTVSYGHAVATHDSVLEQTLATSYQVVRSLRDRVENEFTNGGDFLGDINNKSRSSSASSSPALSTYKELIKEEKGNYTQRLLHHSANRLTPGDVSFLLQIIHRYETMIGSMQASLTRYTTGAHSGLHVPWSNHISGTAMNQCGVEQYQPATMENLVRQQRHPTGSGSYDIVGLS